MHSAVALCRRAVALVVIAVAGLGLVAPGCGDDSPTAAPTSSSSPPTTTTTTIVATTTSPPPTEPQSSPQAAGTALVRAWRNGDRDAALTVATATAVDSLFSAGEPGSTEDRGCQGDFQTNPQCAYRTGIGELQLRTARQDDGWIVDRATISPD